jgi:hypothetical protein
MTEPTSAVTDEMIDRALDVLYGEMTMPYMTRAADYVTEGSTGELRDAEMVLLRSADEDADRRNRDLIRRALDAALKAR